MPLFCAASEVSGCLDAALDAGRTNAVAAECRARLASFVVGSSASADRIPHAFPFCAGRRTNVRVGAAPLVASLRS